MLSVLAGVLVIGLSFAITPACGDGCAERLEARATETQDVSGCVFATSTETPRARSVALVTKY